MKRPVLVAAKLGTIAALSTFAQAQDCSRDGLKAMAANYFKAVETTCHVRAADKRERARHRKRR